MIYALILPIIKMAIRFYFRKINVIGNENYPKKGAAVLIVNHPSALLDPLVVAITAGRQLHYIAAAEYFGSKFSSWLFKKQFNMIPVYRPDSGASEKVSNNHMFQHCFETLANDGVIIIFPEGTSETEKKLRKLKTGVVRMVLGAEKYTNKHIPIIPVGINYTNPHRFQSDVLLSVGAPMYIDHGIKAEDKEGVISQTLLVEEKLRNEVIHIEDEQLETTIQRVEQIFAKQLQQDLGITNDELERKFTMTKDVIKAVAHFESTSPDSTTSIYKKMDRYYEIIKEIPMNGRLLNHIHSKNNFIEYGKIGLLFPVFLIGFLFNFIPFYFSGEFFKNKFLHRIKTTDKEHQIRPVFGGSIAFGIGTIFFVIWYLLLGVSTLLLYTWWASIIVLIVAYWSAQFSLYYLGVLRNIQEKLKFNKIKLNHSAKINELLLLRAEIIIELKSFADNFLKLSKKQF
ncbi:MAG: 1-acyl-sn-glycerol-3-phosphate acyltransferase [Cyclobacteriaceae bacterium]|nr:1-acyl-sn-glycerol-3-phosphate acyltransferase [Cyclobacteriaceae bacterium]